MNFRAATPSLLVLLVPAFISAWIDPGWCTWQTFTTLDGLASNGVRFILDDHSENLWFATDGGVSRYDGATWRTFTTAEGLPSRGSPGRFALPPDVISNRCH